MGRQVKRVPLDFDWPMGETWLGYLNPYYAHRQDCGACGGTGYSPAARLFSDQWYGYAEFDPEEYGVPILPRDAPEVRAFAERNVDGGTGFYGVDLIGRDEAVRCEMRRLWRDCFAYHWSHNLNQADVDALVAAGRLRDLTHRFEPGKGWQPIDPAPEVRAAEVNLWSLSGIGHDCINKSICVCARCEREGAAVTCAECDGTGEHWPTRAHAALCEAWVDIPPPKGDGWQMWETTSEGSPMSPVFATPEELARWLADSGASSFGRDTATYEQWLGMIGREWAPSAVMSNGRMMSGVEAVAGE